MIKAKGRNNKIAAMAFTDRGEVLARDLMEKVGGETARSGRPDSVRTWASDRFSRYDALVIVGAAGIAFRAVGPLAADKAEDPAVIVIDEAGRYVIPVLSGHLGGANDLARELADLCGGEAVITTATDGRGVFAVDEWTRRQGCVILEPQRIKDISGKLLGGDTVTVRSRWIIEGKVPDGLMLTESEDADVVLDITAGGEKALHAVPAICSLGIGCRRGTGAAELEQFLQRILRETGVNEAAVCGVATIDIKGDEAGLIEFCKKHEWPLQLYSAQELEKAEGKFSPSEFVSRITGVDNVCERSAALHSGGKLIQGKTAGNGITMALAEGPYRPDWRWQDE